MQVAFTPATPAEARLLASFFQDYADLLEVQLAQMQLPGVTQPPADVALPVEAKTEKKSRNKKSVTTAETPAESTSTETVGAVDEGNDSASTATEPATSTEAGATPTATEAIQDSPAASAAEEQVVSLDELRTLFGQLTQAGKRAEAVVVVRKYGANGLAEIKESDRSAVYADLKGLWPCA